MLTLTQWAQSFQPWRRPWLLLGKGPSFDRVGEVDRDAYHVCSLNHVVRELPVTAAHAIDLDVVLECADAIERNAQFLIMPFRPHVDFDPGPRNVFELQDDVPVLGRLARAGRLVYYDLSSAPPSGASPRILARHFSAESAVELLAACGVREVRSLGVDGGDRYGQAFADLEDRTLLAAGHDSFDSQFAGIAAITRRTGLLYAPWQVEAPIRVFVGADPAQRLPARVLEWSLKQHTSISVEVERIDDADLPVPRRPEQRSKTGFSFARFRIPELCGHAGRAIYMDADMLVRADVARLWTLPRGGRPLLYAPQPPGRDGVRYSVLLLDCEQLDWDAAAIVRGLDAGTYDYEQLLRELCVVPTEGQAPGLPPAWNSPEHADAETCLIHYTDMPTQPWVHRGNPHGELWYEALREALAEGFVSPELLEEEVARGHVSPQLPEWIDRPRPRGYHLLRATWVPPFARYSKAATEDSLLRARAALARVPRSRLWRRLGLPGAHSGEASSYRERLESSPAVRGFPFRREEAKPGVDALLERLAGERDLFFAADQAAPVARLVVLVDRPADDELAHTLALWELQSCPRRDTVLLQRPGAGKPEPLRRWAEARAGDLPLAVDRLPLADLPDETFLVFARPGDGLHPSLATALWRVGQCPGADLVAWHAQGPGPTPGTWEDHTSPAREPFTLRSVSGPPRAFALRAGWARRFPGDLLAALDDAGGHPLLRWASSQDELRWETHPEFLTAYGARPQPSPPCPVDAPPAEATLSVVIPFPDDLETTLPALQTVLAQSTHRPCELVLVAHRVTPATRAALEAWLDARLVAPERVRWVAYDGPFNHSRQCDLGAQAATGDALLFLNNDARLTSPGLLEALTRWALHPGVGTVGCRLTTAEGALVSAGVRVLPRRARPWSPPVEESRQPGYAEVLRETVANSYACAALSQATYQAAGPLDAACFPAGYNDVDHCLRLRRLGYRHLYLGHLQAVHEPGGSRAACDELPQILELWRRYPELGELGRRQLDRVVYPLAQPLGLRAREQLKSRVPAGVRRALAHLLLGR